MSLVLVVGFAMSGQAATSTIRCEAGDVSCLVEAIEASNSSGLESTILLAAGVYTLDPTQHPSVLPNGLHSTGNLTIRGAGAHVTIIQRASASEPFRILLFEGTLSLEELTIQGGDASAGGFTNGAGGAIAGEGILTIRKCRIASNRALSGGGLSAGGTVKVIDSVIESNTATGLGGAAGGGGLTVGGNVTISGSTIARNTTSGAGGGISLGGSVTVEGTAIVENRSLLFGGGIFESGFASVTVSKSTIAGNVSGFAGGAIQSGIPDFPAPCCGGFITIENSTISNNRSGGVDGPTLATNPKLVTLRGTILAGNTAPFGPIDCRISLTSLGHNFFGACPSVTPVASDIHGDPLLGDLVDVGTPGRAHLPLSSGSPAIDAGEDASCGSMDQLGLRRPADGNGDGVRRCDIGATEFYPVVNESLLLESVNGIYLAPTGDPTTDTISPGGRYRVNARFTNVSSASLCSISIRVATLQGASGPGPVVLTPDGTPAGGAGAVIRAEALGADDDIAPFGQADFSFVIGLKKKETFTFFVDFLGEPLGSICQ